MADNNERTPLLKVDLDAIRAAGHPVEQVVFTVET